MDTRPEPSGDGHELTAAFMAELPGGRRRSSPEEAAFLTAVLEDYRSDELPFANAADIGRLAGRLWRLAASPGLSAPLVRIAPATSTDGEALPADLVEVTQPDAPFLVDSVMGALVDAGANVLAMYHPIAVLAEGRRSAIQVWLEPLGEERYGALEVTLREVLAEVRRAVDDFQPMLALLRRSIEHLKVTAPHRDEGALAEAIALLRWAEDGHFVFLGARTYEYPRTEDGGYEPEEPSYQPDAGYGVLRDPARKVLRRGSEPAVLSKAMREGLAQAPPLVVAKANLKSVVHRRAYMDYLGVRRYGDDGRASGEVRFVGLFTAQAYDEAAHEVPLVRRKVERVMRRAGQAVGGHNEMRLSNILESYPRDELFQMDEEELLDIALGILHLSDRPKAKLFVRRDPFDRFISILFYAPRSRLDSSLIERVGQMLAQAYGGHVSAVHPSYSDAPLARTHYIIGVTPGDNLQPDLSELERAVAQAARTWRDEFEALAHRETPLLEVGSLLETWRDAFPPGFQDINAPAEALADVGAMRRLGPDRPLVVRAFREDGDAFDCFRIKLYREGEPLPLAEVLPIFEDMGLKALSEDGFPVSPTGPDGTRRTIWTHEFKLQDPSGQPFDLEASKAVLEEAFWAVWTGLAESDGFNRLVLKLSTSWRSAALVRALARYRQQSGLDPTPAVQQQALADYPEVAALILELFEVRFNPARSCDLAARKAQGKEIEVRIESALQGVESLDADRALRRMAALVGAIQRTNFHQEGPDGAPKPYISFKVASRELAELPDPKPFREIYVASPAVEGVHLRLGPVARGGLRWSDRRDDFRTEVLALAKAQQVKNAVIVPVGSKGGFFPKRLPKGGPGRAVQAEAISAYKTFLSGLLDLTDTIDAKDQVAHPPGVVVHDGDDPYLVVAADKGTASFSDIANGVAESYGFWLGDAFASGGSAGYDHKAMGITARGAWESVKRHFRELGKDIQAEPFTCVGVGDMSGDVFGNGMLRSEKTKLVAAFDHRHVFIDPDPDPERAFAERRRLFELPGSSWADYDLTLISQGGGVFPRSAKQVRLSPEAKALLDVKAEELIPAEVIKAILRARVELLYLGGIGTYVKASAQSQAEAEDKVNDPVRVNGAELRCKVVGEGANLGFTQGARIEFALKGGRINSDAIDNSAGVDTSDHEVNLKILTSMAERAGKLTRPGRDVLLAGMTDEIAAHVLAHNYGQTLALSILEAEALDEAPAYIQLMDALEARNGFDRALEGLPDDDQFTARVKEGCGLTRPELAVLLALGKIDFIDQLIATAAPDDPHFFQTLHGYFPSGLAPFEEEMRRHRLRREIIVTVLAGEMVDVCGPTFPGRIMAAAGCGAAELAISFEAARQVLDFSEIWARVGGLDGRCPAAGQTALYRELAYVLRGQTYWLARMAAKSPTTVDALVSAYRGPADELKAIFPQVLSAFEQKAAVRRAERWIKAGAPKDLAHTVTLYRPLTLTVVLADLARALRWPVQPAARIYHAVGGAFGFDRLRSAAGSHARGDPYERLAVRRLVEDLQTEQGALTRAIMTYAGKPEAGEDAERARQAIASWSALNDEAVRLARKTIADIEKDGGGWSFAKLTIANAALKALA
jgi:glutamate dehydrogenase